MGMWAARPSRRPARRALPLFEFLLNAYLYAGIINSDGRLWKSQRRFLHDKLREFGMTYMGNGKKIMESRIMVRQSTFQSKHKNFYHLKKNIK